MAGLSIRSGMTWSPLLAPIRLPVSLASHSPRHQRGVARCGAAGGEDTLSYSVCLHICLESVFHLFLHLDCYPVWFPVVCESILGFLVFAWCFISIFGVKQLLLFCFYCIEKTTFEAKSPVQWGLLLLIFFGNLFYRSLLDGCCCAC